MRNLVLSVALLACLIAMPENVTAQHYVQSPQVHPDRSVTFQYYAPAASSVLLQGNVPEIAGDMKRGVDGVWKLTVGPLAPDTYPYRFSVDKSVVLDPVNRQTKAWMWMENLVDVPANLDAGEQPAIHQVQNVPHGAVRQHWYHSTGMQRTRSLFVYTPPGYEKGTQNYPVLYLLHGFGDDESAWSRVGQANHIADNVLAAGQAVPVIIVMPFGHIELPTSPDFQKYALLDNIRAVEAELLSGVMPFVESTFRCKSGKSNRAVAGLSMGGGHALQFGLNNLDKFGFVAGFSSSIEKQAVMETAEDQLSKLKSEPPWLWLGCGKDDFLFEETVAFDKWLAEHNVPHMTRLTEGAHNWRCWRRYLAEVLSEIFPKQ